MLAEDAGLNSIAKTILVMFAGVAAAPVNLMPMSRGESDFCTL